MMIYDAHKDIYVEYACSQRRDCDNSILFQLVNRPRINSLCKCAFDVDFPCSCLCLSIILLFSFVFETGYVCLNLSGLLCRERVNQTFTGDLVNYVVSSFDDHHN